MAATAEDILAQYTFAEQWAMQESVLLKRDFRMTRVDAFDVTQKATFAFDALARRM